MAFGKNPVGRVGAYVDDHEILRTTYSADNEGAVTLTPYQRTVVVTRGSASTANDLTVSLPPAPSMPDAEVLLMVSGTGSGKVYLQATGQREGILGTATSFEVGTAGEWVAVKATKGLQWSLLSTNNQSLWATSFGDIETASTAESATGIDINTGLTTVDSFIVQILRGGNVVTADAKVVITGETARISGGTSYTFTNGDKIHWIAVGE